MYRFVLFILLTLGLLFGAHWLLYRSWVRFFSITHPPAQRLMMLALVFLGVSLLAATLVARFSGHFLAVAWYWVGMTWLGLLINLLVALGAIWLVFGLARLAGRSLPMQWVALCGFGLAVLYTLWGMYAAFHPQTRHMRVELAGLPAEWRGKTIVHLSDVHLGKIHGLGFLEGLVETVNALEPDLVLITGDLFDGMGEGLERFVEPLSSLRAKRGVFFTRGNHEVYARRLRPLELLRRTGIRVLEDQVVVLDGLQIAGVGYPGPEKDLSDQIRRDLPAILMFHLPASIEPRPPTPEGQREGTYWSPDIRFDHTQQMGIDLQLSGHTHVGQIFPFNLLTHLLYRGYDRGLHRLGSFQLYTSAGVGNWGPPLRTGSRTEIAVFHLDKIP